MTSAPAWDLLSEMRDDPYGYSWMDVHKLLKSFHFQEESLGVSMIGEARLLYHKAHPELNVTLFPVETVHSDVVLWSVRLVDILTADSEWDTLQDTENGTPCHH